MSKYDLEWGCYYIFCVCLGAGLALFFDKNGKTARALLWRFRLAVLFLIMLRSILLEAFHKAFTEDK